VPYCHNDCAGTEKEELGTGTDENNLLDGDENYERGQVFKRRYAK
jgi:hypothetical protein